MAPLQDCMSSLYKVLNSALLPLLGTSLSLPLLETTCIHADITSVQFLPKADVLQDCSSALGEAAMLHSMQALPSLPGRKLKLEQGWAQTDGAIEHSPLTPAAS